MWCEGAPSTTVQPMSAVLIVVLWYDGVKAQRVAWTRDEYEFSLDAKTRRGLLVFLLFGCVQPAA